jgi:hypothetical protein
MKYMQVFEEVTLVQGTFKEFISYLNPTLDYNVLCNIYYKELAGCWLFEKSEQNEIMFIAQLMKSSISVADEPIIL